MEENNAKTTEAEAIGLPGDGADAGTVASETVGENLDGLNDGAPENAGAQDEDVARINRENARRRREVEREKALGEARERAIIETLDGKNPYDGSELRDGADVARFLEMKRAYLEREAEEEKETAAREEWFRGDRDAFRAAYPDVDLDALIEDERFRTFSEGKVGNLPMKTIYEGYREFLGAFDEKAKSLAAQALANRAAGPGALGGAKHAEGDSYTAEEVRRMSPAEVRANYEKIRNSMTKW
ncbi:MAG: hypothetical protein E7643_01485 [Ruminococcaceae bacterium]|nr:hypothetical protein [Oscillospiraceae bacterium]